jgi:rhamnose utilization protein RhaD (predicted bifunctional aldolase and dehydrogenase)
VCLVLQQLGLIENQDTETAFELIITLVSEAEEIESLQQATGIEATADTVEKIVTITYLQSDTVDELSRLSTLNILMDSKLEFPVIGLIPDICPKS